MLSLFYFKTLVLLFLGVGAGWMIAVEAQEDRKFKQGQPIKEYEIIQKNVFCDNNKDGSSQSRCFRMNENYLKFFFSVFLTIGWGGAVRTVIKTFELSIPYTVVLLMTGLLIGLGARVNLEFCQEWTQYTRFARAPPELILYIFLPLLIFESAFSMKAHVFFRNLLAISVVALPGMLLTTFITAIACRQFMNDYKWTFSQASLFGSIISATDPVAVVAILKELGTSESLSVMIEGESLLNDGVAILLYEIFKEIVEAPESEDKGQLAHVAFLFFRIAILGPIFGFLMGKITIFSLSFIFNDAATEITITLVSAYLTYFIAEFYAQVSGVMAVVLLGVTLREQSTCISPEVEHVVHQFWETMSFVANTVLFVILGIVISETAINSFEIQDGYNIIWLYFALNVIRLLMLLLLSPVLSRIGYNLSYSTLTVMMWGGLRGAVGICLALEVYKSKELCRLGQLGPKILLQTAGIVICTLLINGTTTKALLDYLGVTTLSIGKLQDMANAVKTMTASRVRTITVLKHDRFLADSNWEVVHQFTHLKDPYAKKYKVHDIKTQKLYEIRMRNLHQTPGRLGEMLVTGESLSTVPLNQAESWGPSGMSIDDPLAVINNVPTKISLYHLANQYHPHDRSHKKSRTTASSQYQLGLGVGIIRNGYSERKSSDGHDQEDQEDGGQDLENKPTKKSKQKDRASFSELKALMEESRLRVLKAMKISCWRQYERGLLSQEAVKLLVGEIESKEDNLLEMIHMDHIRTYWDDKGAFAWIQKKIHTFMGEDIVTPMPAAKWRQPIYYLTGSKWFTGFIYLVILVNTIPIIGAIHLQASKKVGSSLEITFLFWSTVVFTSIYFLEFLLKIIGHGFGEYFSSRWNQLDFFILIVSLIEFGLTIPNQSSKSGFLGSLRLFRNLRLFRLVRLLKWAKPIIPLITRVIEYGINKKLFMGYEIGKGFIQSLEDALRFIPHMIENQKIARKFKSVLESDRLKTIKELALLQMSHPGVVIAVKTRHASRSISNQMRDDLEDLRLDGILGEKELFLLNSIIEGNLKKLWASPASVKPIQAENMLQNISWVVGHHDLLSYLKANLVEHTFTAGEVLYKAGDSPNGIYMIITGLVKLQFEPTEEILKELNDYGIVPNTELILDLSFRSSAIDYLGTGCIIGELGILTGLPRAATIYCETDIEMFHWTQATMQTALRLFDNEFDSLEARLWRSYGIRLASEFLHTQNAYEAWPADKIRAHLEQTMVPIGPEFSILEIPEVVHKTMLIFGQIVNVNNGGLLEAPALLPTTWSKIGPVSGSIPYNRQYKLLILVEEEGVQQILEHGTLSLLEKCIIHSPGVSLTLVDEGDYENPDSLDKAQATIRRQSIIALTISMASRRRSTRELQQSSEMIL